jgi:hypothetical protein
LSSNRRLFDQVWLLLMLPPTAAFGAAIFLCSLCFLVIAQPRAGASGVAAE